MYTQASNPPLAESATGEVLIPLIRAAATIGFAIAPCSLGFVIIAVSEHLIRSILVGDEPEMLMSDLQNRFPNDDIEIIKNDDAGLVAQVVDSIERPDRALKLLDDAICSNGTRKRESEARLGLLTIGNTSVRNGPSCVPKARGRRTNPTLQDVFETCFLDVGCVTD